MLATDLSHLPKAGHDRAGNPPDPNPRFVQVLAESWQAADIAEGERPRASATARFRHSDAGRCARAIAFAATDTPRTNPMDLSGVMATRIGTLIHDAWQAAIQARYPNATVEEVVSSGERAGHIDLVVRGDITTAVELKTIGGFAYKMAIGERGPAQGPKHEHVIQAALNGCDVDADEIVVAYLSKEAVSVNVAKRKHLDELGRFCAEWTFDRDTYRPIAEAEHARIAGILDLVDKGLLPARRMTDPELPVGHEIVDPTTGRWEKHAPDGTLVDTGTWWACGYCPWQTRCATTASGRVARKGA